MFTGTSIGNVLIKRYEPGMTLWLFSYFVKLLPLQAKAPLPDRVVPGKKGRKC
ncbi:hypothetical protein MICA_2309 [Micavibrio aeruginosavorus ARL-13]|uniref:Uncharacterized protein n=1 Tax=Micavibrio aeruginosavorus (strain ARL-13) TaxID=856793 RepID=G2KT68_MICAA|nr:hypothetical protein MICA_2309 [Micavibrio aeruginosavorus ARL-13]